jgi:hypothetical protein
MPAMKIAGLCLPLKPQKERSYNKKQLDLVPLLLTLFKTAYNIDQKNKILKLKKSGLCGYSVDWIFLVLLRLLLDKIIRSGVKVKTFSK